ncbi:MEDS domain-containing protein [Streptomyces sp. TRM64462]|uniref:MEDS domain-containing protein n=1 Tax=Streptomyces sp. TRM64462 TaxID=2741726 RepID=UPI0015860F17|nr:MEDS domain-containing protein [Streptomyces sp. TRM64462]
MGRPVGDERHPGTLPVQHLRPGDHAFLCYDSETPGWDVLTAFVWTGLARGEKVIVFGPPRLSDAELRTRLSDAPGPLVAAGCESAQLTLGSIRELILPARRFTAERQWQRITEEARAARDDGYSGLRAYIDMGWVLDVGEGDFDLMMDRERRAGHLFTDGFYSEICAYERTRFPGPVLEAMCRAHPRNLLPALGQLRIQRGASVLRVIGDADTATYERFGRAVADLLRDPPRDRPVTVDLLRTGFLGADCAAELVRAVARAPARPPVRIRCSPGHALLLRRCGADPAVLDTAG